nr:immunoglobulin light chain junction region [Homo sapiens]
SLEPEDFAVY